MARKNKESLIQALAKKEATFNDGAKSKVGQSELLIEEASRLREQAATEREHAKALNEALDILARAGVVI